MGCGGISGEETEDKNQTEPSLGEVTLQLLIQEERRGGARPTHRNNGEEWGAFPGTQSGEGTPRATHC